jgi:hypothetical protein
MQRNILFAVSKPTQPEQSLRNTQQKTAVISFMMLWYSLVHLVKIKPSILFGLLAMKLLEPNIMLPLIGMI